MKICLINNLYKPYNRGGAESIVEQSVKNILKQNNQVFIITTKPRYQSSIFNEQCSMKKYYLPSFYYNLNKIPLFLRFFWHIWDMFDVLNYFRVKKILKKEKPNIIITHNLKGISFLIPLLIKQLKIKHIHILHDIQLLHPSGLILYGQENKINSLFAKIYAQICKKLFASPDITKFPSKWLMKIYTNKGFFQKSKKEISIKTSPLKFIRNNTKNKFKKFLYVGQIETHKGILFLIKVFQKLNHQLIIVGNGSQLTNIKNQAKNNKDIVILGKKNKQEIKKLMQKINYLIVPSLCYENSPTVIHEAIQVNLPVIASNIGGIPELVNNKLLFKPGNEKELLSIIAKI